MSQSRRPEEIEALAAEFKASGLRELHLRCDDFELYLSNDARSAGLDASGMILAESTPVRAAPPPVAPERSSESPRAQAERPAAEAPDGLVFVRAPYMGSFYRSPKPGAPPFVEVGSVVTPQTDLCLVEVMKLFTAVRAPVAGRVHAVLVEDGKMVEADQPLFELIPD